MQQQESDDENNSTNSSGLPFPGSLSELFNEQDSQQLADLLSWRIFSSSSIRTASWCTAGGGGACIVIMLQRYLAVRFAYCFLDFLLMFVYHSKALLRKLFKLSSRSVYT
jgi:hypothetical protein